MKQHPALILSCLATLLLGACGYAIETSNQDITFLTPGAKGAHCDVYVNKLRYQASPPQKINIRKSSKDMQVSCTAPGNRKVDMDVPANISSKALWGGPAGVAWDYGAQTLHDYPSVIAVDFTHVKTSANDMPLHNSPDNDQPESHDLEEFRALTPMLNSDKGKEPVHPVRRDDVSLMQDGEEVVMPDAEEEEQQAVQKDKGSLMSILDRLGMGDDDSAKDGQAEIPAPVPTPAPQPVTEPVQQEPIGEADSAPVPIFSE